VYNTIKWRFLLNGRELSGRTGGGVAAAVAVTAEVIGGGGGGEGKWDQENGVKVKGTGWKDVYIFIM